MTSLDTQSFQMIIKNNKKIIIFSNDKPGENVLILDLLRTLVEK